MKYLKKAKISIVLLLFIGLSTSTTDPYLPNLGLNPPTTYTVCSWNSSDIKVKGVRIAIGQTFKKNTELTFSRANQYVLAIYKQGSLRKAKIFIYSCRSGVCSIKEKSAQSVPDLEKCTGLTR